MEEERARALLRAERQRLERLLASVDADHDRVAPADKVAEAEERAADGEDHAVRGPDLVDAARLGPSREPFQVLLDPAVQDNPRPRTMRRPSTSRRPSMTRPCPMCLATSPRTTPAASAPSPSAAARTRIRQR
jgi:hypothetical protein